MSVRAEEKTGVRPRRPTKAEKSLDNETSKQQQDEPEGAGIGVLDVVKAIAPLLIIIAIALGMLVLGYVFLPETLSTSIFQHTSTSPSSSTPTPPTPKEDAAATDIEEYYDDIEICVEVMDVKHIISALKDFTRWKDLGTKLSMSEEHLRSIDAENQNDAELKKRAMLRMWYNTEQAREGRVCWYHLLDALILLREIQLAGKIAKANGIIWDD